MTGIMNYINTALRNTVGQFQQGTVACRWPSRLKHVARRLTFKCYVMKVNVSGNKVGLDMVKCAKVIMDSFGMLKEYN